MAAGFAVWALLAAGGAGAQGGPAELPPESFAGAQYVDSRGCAFVRATLSGETVWVPRLTAERRPVCGLAPSLAGGVSLAEAASPAAAPAEEGAAAPSGHAGSGPGAPIPTVALTMATQRPASPAVPMPVRSPAGAAAAATPMPVPGAAGCHYEMVGGAAYVPAGPHCGAGRGGTVVVVPVEAAQTLTRTAQATRGMASPAFDPLLPFDSPVPASNPVGLVPQEVAPPPGYEPVWDDGRINPWRGLPRPVSGPVLMGGSAILPYPG